MVYNFVNGNIIIAKIHDELNVKSRDWENRVPKWITDCLKALNINPSFEEAVVDLDIINNKVKLPFDIRVLRGVIVDGHPIERVTTVYDKPENDKYALSNVTALYTINDGHIVLNKKEGKVRLIYWKLPLEWDDTLGMWIPMIPDEEAVIEHITWYVFKIILARGYIHPVYSLSSRDEDTNPNRLWRNTKRAARLAAASMDNEGRRIMAETLSKFMTNPKANIQELFSKYNITNRRADKGWKQIYRFTDVVPDTHDEERVIDTWEENNE